MNNSELHRYALVGAEARLVAIAAETDAVYRIFPDLRSRPAAEPTTPEKPKAQRQGRAAAASKENGGGSRKRGMNAAQRKAVGERMTRYWAARRAQSQQPNGKNGQPEAAAVTTAAPATNRPGASGRARGPRTMSAAARKRISDAQRARWARQRGEKAGKPAKTAKKTRARA